MSHNRRIAVVTGANKGIGLEVCRQLGEMGLRVILTARDPQKGEAATMGLADRGVAVEFYPLDVTSDESVAAIANYLDSEVGGLDVLVNNAGVFPDDIKDGSVFRTTRAVLRAAMETNAFGPAMVCQALVPLMRRGGYGRIVNVSSGMGQLADMNGECPGYRLSKTALNALTCILADELKHTNILVNSMCPGWVKTDMGGPNAERSVEVGADTAVWLATLPDDGPRGGFFRDRKAVPW